MGNQAALIIFDCDGVLVDSEPIANRVLHRVLAGIGLEMSEEEVMRAYIGRSRAGCVALTEEKLGRPVPQDFVAGWNAALFAAFERELQPMPGVGDLLRRLPLPSCVASNSSEDRVKVALRATGLLAAFEGRVFTADAVARPKPAPDLFLHAARVMGVEPARCTVVEDSPGGVRAAIAAGMTVLGYAGGSHADAQALRTAGAQVFTDMDSLFN
jgi:HAD superfamily hydrolase (TIGR01509 family)